MIDECPFCGCEPYHYEDVGTGGRGVPVAVVCCELGVEWFKRRETPADNVSISWEDFDRFARVFEALRTLGMRP